MEQKINNDNVYDFYKLLVELGDTYYVDRNHVILKVDDDQPVGVKVSNKPLPISLFKDGMACGEYVILNPLVEGAAKTLETEWFYNTRALVPGAMIKFSIGRLAELAVDKTSEFDYKVLNFVEEYLDKLDKTMVAEINKIEISDWAYIFYDKTTRTAQLQSDIFDEEIETKYKSKVRKSTWPVLRGLVSKFLGTDDVESNYTFEGKIPACQRADAFLNILVKACGAMGTHVKQIIGIDLSPVKLKTHLQNLEKYAKIVAWITTGTAQSSGKQQEKKPTSSLPWTTKSVPSGESIPSTSVSSGVPMNAKRPGMIENPILVAKREALLAAGEPPASAVPILGSSNATYTGVIQDAFLTSGNVRSPLLLAPAFGGGGRSLSGVPIL